MCGIFGYVGKPEFATKNNAKQYFFVNNRFMKNGYFHKAVTLAFDKLINAGTKPSYFLFFNINPQKIDVNIHPTKTEINFDEANNIFQIILSAIRKSLTDFDIPPAIDFENTDFVNSIIDENREVKMPEIKLNPVYNPFDEAEKQFNFHSKISKNRNIKDDTNLIFTDNFENKEGTSKHKQFINLKNKYILTPVKSGLMTIHIHRALKQIDFEKILNIISNQTNSTQALYPVQINFSSIDLQEFELIKDKLENIGFQFERITNSSYNITGTPSYVNIEDSHETIIKILKISELTNIDFDGQNKEEIAIQIIKAKNKKINLPLKNEEVQEIMNKLFTCKSHQYTFDGKTIVNIIEIDQLDKLF